MLTDASGKSLVGLLLSLKANIKMREDDIPNNVPSKLTIKGKPKVITAKTPT